MKINPTFLEIVLLLTISFLVYIWTRYGKKIRRWWEDIHKQHRGPYQLKPKPPTACPRCATGYHRLPRRPRRDVVPWKDLKGKAGKKKQFDTTGYACVNPDCQYRGITNPAVHALVSDGCRGVRKDIPYLKCQACGKKTTSRFDTPMKDLKTPTERVAMVATAMVEGLDISAASRIFGHHPTTIANWVKRCGLHSARLHQRLLFQALEVGHVQLDELVTKVRNQAGKVFVWTAVAARSRLVIGVSMGDRTIANACLLVHQIVLSLIPGCMPVFTSDGLNHYFYALTAHYGHYEKPPRARKLHWFSDDNLQYAQLRKERRGRKVRFLYSIIRAGERTAIRTALKKLGFSGKIQTSYVERNNLTLRELIAALSRRTWSIAFDIYHLWLHTMWGVCYYNYIRINMSLDIRIRGPAKRRRRTPAMAAGLTKRPWSVSEFILLPVSKDCWSSPLRLA
jgi:IS1 family transposase/transposase-like protein